MMPSPFVVNDPRLEFDPAQHVYRLGDRVLPSVTQILKAVGIADFSSPWFSADITTRGSLMHAAIALDVEGTLDEATLDPVLVPYVAGWRKFVADTGAIVEHWETAVCDPVLGYAGALDGVIRILRPRPRRYVVDLKRGLYASVGPQLSGYTRLARLLYDEPVHLERAALELPGDGSYRWHHLTNRDDDSTFLAALRVVTWRLANGLKCD